MSNAAVITIFIVCAAYLYSLPNYRRLIIIFLFFSFIDRLVISITLGLVCYFQFGYEYFSQKGFTLLSQGFLTEIGFSTKSLAAILLVWLAMYIVIRVQLRRASLRYRIRKFTDIVRYLMQDRNYPELFNIVKRHLEAVKQFQARDTLSQMLDNYEKLNTLPEVVEGDRDIIEENDGDKVLTLAESQLKEFKQLASSTEIEAHGKHDIQEIKGGKIVSPLDEFKFFFAREIKATIKIKNFFFPQDDISKEIVKNILGDEILIKIIAIMNPYYGLDIIQLEFQENQIFLYYFVKALVYNEESIIYNEIKSSHSVPKSAGRYIISSTEKVLSSLFSDTKRSNDGALYQPLSDVLIETLDKQFKLSQPKEVVAHLPGSLENIAANAEDDSIKEEDETEASAEEVPAEVPIEPPAKPPAMMDQIEAPPSLLSGTANNNEEEVRELTNEERQLERLLEEVSEDEAVGESMDNILILSRTNQLKEMLIEEKENLKTVSNDQLKEMMTEHIVDLEQQIAELEKLSKKKVKPALPPSEEVNYVASKPGDPIISLERQDGGEINNGSAATGNGEVSTEGLMQAQGVSYLDLNTAEIELGEIEFMEYESPKRSQDDEGADEKLVDSYNDYMDEYATRDCWLSHIYVAFRIFDVMTANAIRGRLQCDRWIYCYISATQKILRNLVSEKELKIREDEDPDEIFLTRYHYLLSEQIENLVRWVHVAFHVYIEAYRDLPVEADPKKEKEQHVNLLPDAYVIILIKCMMMLLLATKLDTKFKQHISSKIVVLYMKLIEHEATYTERLLPRIGSKILMDAIKTEGLQNKARQECVETILASLELKEITDNYQFEEIANFKRALA